MSYVQDYIIFLDEEVIPSADFLSFFRQSFEAMTSDKTLSGISAWNPYGAYKIIFLLRITGHVAKKN